MFKTGDGFGSSFIVQRPGQPISTSGFGAEVVFHRRELVRTALFVRREGPAYLRYMSVNDIWSMLTSFVTKNYWVLLEEVFFAHFDHSYLEHVSEGSKQQLVQLIAASSIFNPVDELTAFPLVPIKVKADFDSAPFFLIAPEALLTRLPSGINPRWIVPGQFPPTAQWEGRKEAPQSWLGIRSPMLQSSHKMRAAILGAVALTPLPRYRYLFSGRAMFGGRCTLAGGCPMSFGEPHTPALMDDITITGDDHAWLEMLAAKVMAPERAVRRQMHALEYFYRAWFLDPRERFPVLCMTLDAVFGDANHATQAVIDGVRTTIGEHVPDARLRTLMELRASVIHGGAPDVYDSRKYARYYDNYDADPIFDLELVVARCLRRLVFEDKLKSHPDPHAATIKAAQEKGRFPKKLSEHTILSDEE
jgi:hypothetical protein